MTPDLMRAFLQEHVRRFNRGVRTGNFDPMLETFDVNAEMAFEGVPVGPFRGRSSIAEAYRNQPPTDEMLVLSFQTLEDTIVARYAWKSAPDRAAGTMRLRMQGDLVGRLEVAFD